jgi:hypothetical protein
MSDGGRGGSCWSGWRASSRFLSLFRQRELIIPRRTALRLSLLIATKRPVLPFPLAQREIDPSVLTQDTSTQPTTPPAPHIVLDFPLDAPAHAYLTPLVPRLPEAYQSDPRTLLPEIQGWREWLGEGMQASEGLVSVLVYAVLASRRRGRAVQGGAGMMDIARENRWTSTIPLLWVLLARTLRRPARGTTPLLAETYGSRDRALMFHLVRGAIWQRWTRGKVMRLVQGLEKVWGVRLVAGIVRDHVELVDEYYYCECWFCVWERRLMGCHRYGDVGNLDDACTRWHLSLCERSLVVLGTMMHSSTSAVNASRFKFHAFPSNPALYFFPSCASANEAISTNSQGHDVYSPRLVASSSNVVSTAVRGICTYRTTEPRIKQFFTDICRPDARSAHESGVIISGRRTHHVWESFRV